MISLLGKNHWFFFSQEPYQMGRALICVTLLIAPRSNRGVYGKALRSRKEVLVSTVPIPMCHLWSTDGYLLPVSYFCYTHTFIRLLYLHCLHRRRENYHSTCRKERKKRKKLKFMHRRILCSMTQLLWLIWSCLIKKMSISFWIADDTFILWVLIL